MKDTTNVVRKDGNRAVWTTQVQGTKTVVLPDGQVYVLKDGRLIKQ